jgi:hypothetical protein
MADMSINQVLQGLVFDYLGLVIAILTIVQIVWGLFARE